MNAIVGSQGCAAPLQCNRSSRSIATRLGVLLCLCIAAAVPMCGHAATLTTLLLSQVTEGGPDATVAVQLAFDVGENPANCQVSGTLATQDGSAIAGSDYQAINAPFTLALTVAAASVQQQITIPIINDTIAEPDEAFDTVINAVDLAACPLSVTIVKNTTIAIADDDTGTVPTARNLTEIRTLTPNQLALATWFDDVCPRLAAAGAKTPDQEDLLAVCTNLTDPATTETQVVGALDAINPEPMLSAASITLRLSNQQHGNLEQRINALRSGATGIDLAALDLNIGGQQVSGTALQSLLDTLTGGGASADDFGRWGVFVNGRINYGEQDPTENQTGFDFDTIGITSGVDYRIRDNFVIGAALGYSQIKADFDQSVGHLDIETWNVSLFGTYFSDDKFYVDAALNYGDNGYDSVRRIVYTDAGGTVDRTAKSDSSGMESSLGLATGYDFGHGAWTFGPHAGSYYYDVDVNEFRETGAGALDMIVGDQNAASFTVNGGGHLSYVITPSWGVLIPHLRADYVHEFKDSRDLIGIQVAADPFSADPLNPSPTITLRTDRPDTDYVVWSAGLSAQFINGMSGFANYQSTAGYNNLTLTELTLGLRWERSF